MMFGCMLTLLFLPFFFCWIFFWNTPCCSFLLFSFWSVKNLHDDDNLKLDLISLNLLVFRFLLLLFNLSNFKLSSSWKFLTDQNEKNKKLQQGVFQKKKYNKKRKAEKVKSTYNRTSLKQKLRPSKPKMKTKIVKKVSCGLNHFESAC